MTKTSTSSTTPDTGSQKSPSTTPMIPTWRLSHKWAHYGGNIDDAMREAIEAPGGRVMFRRGQGSEPTLWDYVMDIADIFERVQ